MTAIDDIKQKIDIVEVIGQYTKLTKSGKTFKGLCPFHSEKHGSFFVYPEQQSWHCFGACNTGGDVFSFLMKKEGLTFADTLNQLAERAGVALVPLVQKTPEEEREKERLYEVNQAAAQFFTNLLINSPTGEKPKQYLLGRGLTLKTMTEFQLGFSPPEWETLKNYLTEKSFTKEELLLAGLVIESEKGPVHDRFRNRIIFPIQDARGRVIGFGGRAMDDVPPKYLNSPQTPVFDKSENFYAFHTASAAIKKQDYAVIVEGYMDALMAHQAGFTNVIASMGTAITDTHINKLKKLSRNLILALDPDAAGEEAMLRCAGYENILENEIKVMSLPEGKDPDEVILENGQIWLELIQKAVPVVDYTFSMITARVDMTTVKGREQALQLLGPVVNEMKETVRRAHYRQKLAEVLRISESDVTRALAALKHPVNRIKPQSAPAPVMQVFPVSVEEYLLALLLDHPDLKDTLQDAGFKERYGEITPEYFSHSENKEIFVALQKTNDLSLRVGVLPSIDEHLNRILERSRARPLFEDSGRKEEILGDCILRLREQFLKNSEREISQALRLAADGGDAEADTGSLVERSRQISAELKGIYTRKSGKVK